MFRHQLRQLGMTYQKGKKAKSQIYLGFFFCKWILLSLSYHCKVYQPSRTGFIKVDQKLRIGLGMYCALFY